MRKEPEVEGFNQDCYQVSYYCRLNGPLVKPFIFDNDPASQHVTSYGIVSSGK